MAGVFEHDGETGYFYLYQISNDQGSKILDSIHIVSGPAKFSEADIEIRWDRSAEKVGLFIKGQLWAMFDNANKTKQGGNFKSNGGPSFSSDAFGDADTEAREKQDVK